jgi:hypothetical protein
MIRMSSSLAGSFMPFCSTWRHLAKAIEAGALRGNVEGAIA